MIVGRGFGDRRSMKHACLVLIGLQLVFVRSAFADAKSDAHDLYKQGKFAEAAAKYKQAAHEHPTDPGIWWNLGFTYRKLARYQEALTSFQKAGSLDPTHGFASQPGKFEEIIAATTKALKAAPKSSQSPSAKPDPLSKLPEVIALKNGNVYVEPSELSRVDSHTLADTSAALKSKAVVKFIVLGKEYHGNQLARYAASIHRALGLGNGYLLVAAKGGVTAVSNSTPHDQLQAKAYQVAGQIRRGEVTSGLERLAKLILP
jgi:tetratricopeptide (TPR) repeat protein